MKFHPDGSEMTICVREYRYYKNHGHLKPEKLVSRPKKNYCESCGETTARAYYNHPDHDIEMTICSREYDHYMRYGVLKPMRRVILRQKDICESCGDTKSSNYYNHPDPAVDMIICKREYTYYRNSGRLPEARINKRRE